MQRLLPACLSVWYRDGPLRSAAASLMLNSLNLSEGACGQKNMEKKKKRRIIGFISSLSLIVSSSISLSPLQLLPLLSALASPKGLFAFYLSMRCIPSFSIAPLPAPFWVLLTNKRLHVRKPGMCWRELCTPRCGILPGALAEARSPGGMLCCNTFGVPERWSLQHEASYFCC